MIASLLCHVARIHAEFRTDLPLAQPAHRSGATGLARSPAYPDSRLARRLPFLLIYVAVGSSWRHPSRSDCDSPAHGTYSLLFRSCVTRVTTYHSPNNSFLSAGTPLSEFVLAIPRDHVAQRFLQRPEGDSQLAHRLVGTQLYLGVHDADTFPRD